MDTFLGAPETAYDWMGTAYADDAEGAVALTRLLHDRELVPTEHIVFGIDLWLTNDGGGKPKHKAPDVEAFVLDTTGFTDAESAVAHALKSGDLHLGQFFVELKPEEVSRFFKRCRISLVPPEIFTAGPRLIVPPPKLSPPPNNRSKQF